MKATHTTRLKDSGGIWDSVSHGAYFPGPQQLKLPKRIGQIGKRVLKQMNVSETIIGDSKMSFQKCPVCDGTGIDPHCTIASTTLPVCPVCKGSRIIHSVTGTPGPTMTEKEKDLMNILSNFEQVRKKEVV
jgi:hypothetical protein